MSDTVNNTTIVVDGTQIDEILTRQVKNITLGVMAVVVTRNLSQSVAMSIADVARRLVDLKLPIKWNSF